MSILTEDKINKFKDKIVEKEFKTFEAELDKKIEEMLQAEKVFKQKQQAVYDFVEEHEELVENKTRLDQKNKHKKGE